MAERKYSVEEQSTNWPGKFAVISKQLQTIFGDEILRIHHAGSTAVPGLPGKPTLDVILEVKKLASIDSYDQAMQQHGYEALGAYISPDSRMFVRLEHGHRVINIHVYEPDSVDLRQMLSVRDYLRAHPLEVARYGQLKNDLYQAHPDDYFAYRAGKDEYLQDLTKRALDWWDKQPQA